MKPLQTHQRSWILPFLSGTLFILLVVTVVRLTGYTGFFPSPSPEAIPQQLNHSSHRSIGTQAWGKLTVLELPLAEEEDTATVYQRFTGAPKWFFAGATEKQLLRYFLTLNIRSHDRQMLLNRRNWHVYTGGIEISPPEPVVYGLDAAVRARIYAALSKSTVNALQHRPIVLPQANLERQLAVLGLTPMQILHFKQLLYFSAGRLCLADLGIAQKLLDPRVFQNLIEFLFATPSYRLRLAISDSSDIDALTAYWGRGGREELIKPLLKSLSRVPGGADISISALLPEFPRVRLYHYPDSLHDGPQAAALDCSYSAMNFFNSTPDASFLNPSQVQITLEHDYEPVTGTPSLGDLILVTGEVGEIIHMCNYIADDFVFTKNGMGPTEPWTLMRVSDVSRIYCPAPGTARITVLRMKAPGIRAVSAASR
jgi:hypothetical protein